MGLSSRQPSDADLMTGIRAGGTQRRLYENKLYEKYQYFITDGQRKHRLSDDDCASAYLDTMLIAFENIVSGKFEGRSELKTYLYQIFTNKCVDIIRKKTTNRSSVHDAISLDDSLMQLPDESRTIVQTLIAQSDLERLHRFLRELGDKCRTLVLSWGEGYSDEEIAQTMGYNSAAVAKTSRLRCLEKLRERFFVKPMNTDLETIENYFTGQLTPDARAQFEAALTTDTALAETVAFYLMTKQAAQQEAQKQRRIELSALRKQKQVNRTFWSAPIQWAAAASILLLLGLGWYFLLPQDNTKTLASLTDQYVSEHFMELPTTMDGGTSGVGSVDSVKIGVGLFNEGRLNEANAIFQDVLKRQPDMDTAIKYAGIVSYRQGKYDNAITLFHQLSLQTDLIANPGTFYKALTYLKRGQPLDKSQAKKLLQEVITKNLDGKAEAESFIEFL